LIADTLNKYFTEIGAQLASDLTNSSRSFDTYIDRSPYDFHFRKISVKEVFELLEKIPADKAAGLDNIPGRLLKESAPVIASSLCHIFNQSLITGIFPSQWKIAKVFPLHKGGEKNLATN